MSPRGVERVIDHSMALSLTVPWPVESPRGLVMVTVIFSPSWTMVMGLVLSPRGELIVMSQAPATLAVAA